MAGEAPPAPSPGSARHGDALPSSLGGHASSFNTVGLSSATHLSIEHGNGGGDDDDAEHGNDGKAAGCATSPTRTISSFSLLKDAKPPSFLRQCCRAASRNRGFVIQLFCITLLTRISLFLFVIHLPYLSNDFFLKEAGSTSTWAECAQLEASCRERQTCQEDSGRLEICRIASGRTAEWQSASAAAGLLAGFVLAPIVGRVSDAVGRRPIAQWALIGDVLPAIGLLVYAKTDGASLFLYYGLNVAGSIIAPQQATDVAMTSAIADVSDDAYVRTALAGLYLSSLSIAVVIAAPVASVISSDHAILAGSVVIFVAFLWALCLPETLAPQNRHAMPRRWTTALVGSEGMLPAIRLVLDSRELLGAALAGAFLSYGLMGLQVVTQQFLIVGVGFNVSQMSIALAVMGIGVLFWATVGAQIFRRLLGVRVGVAVLALLSSVQQVAFSLSTGFEMATGLMLGMFLGATHPLLIAYVAGLVGPRMQGQAQGCIQAAGAMTGFVASIGAAQAYKHFVHEPIPGVPAGAQVYWISAGICACAAPISLFMLR